MDKKHLKLTSNLATRLAHNTLGKQKSKYSWQDFTVSILLAVKSFVKNLLMTKSSDCKSDLAKGHASRPNKSTGKHLLLINWRVTSSEVHDQSLKMLHSLRDKMTF